MNVTAATIMLIYPIGFLLTLIFFKFFGERIGMGGYDPPHEGWYDDWDSNAEAYLGFSIGWFIIMPFLIIAGIWKGLVKFNEWFIKL